MERYEAYKDSGIEWIGEIPEGWEVKRLKYLVSINDESLPESTEGDLQIKYVDISNVKSGTGILSTEELSFSEAPSRARRIVRDGDVIVSTVRTYLKSIAKIDNPPKNLIVSTGFAVIRPTIMNPSYIGYVFYSENMIGEIISRSTGISYPAINASEIGDIFTPIPNTEEQTAIVSYLDRKTAEIDALIAQKQRLIELYQEEKTAIINQAVTKGMGVGVPLVGTLNNNGADQGNHKGLPLRDSGIDWLGEIPESWDTKKLKHFIEKLESGVSVNSTDFPVSENGFGILKTSCVYNYQFDPSENKEIWHTEIERAKINPQEGQLIISRMNTPDLVGASGYVEQTHPNLFLPDRLWQTKFYKYAVINTRWLSFLIKSLSFRKLLSILATGTSSSMKNLSQEDFLNIDIPYPNEKEQAAIVHHIETESARIDAKIAKTQRIIELQKEYRIALISEVVTGKIKVTS